MTTGLFIKNTRECYEELIGKLNIQEIKLDNVKPNTICTFIRFHFDEEQNYIFPTSDNCVPYKV